MGVGGQRPGKETQYPLYRRMAGRQGRSGQVRKISPASGFDPRIVHPVVGRYTYWAIPAHIYIRSPDRPPRSESTHTHTHTHTHIYIYIYIYIYKGWSKSLCAPDDYNVHTTDDLKMAITRYIRNVDRAILNTVFENTVRRVNKCLETGGGHFEHYL